jgi:hypothetical protein
MFFRPCLSISDGMELTTWWAQTNASLQPSLPTENLPRRYCIGNTLKLQRWAKGTTDSYYPHLCCPLQAKTSIGKCFWSGNVASAILQVPDSSGGYEDESTDYGGNKIWEIKNIRKANLDKEIIQNHACKQGQSNQFYEKEEKTEIP